MISQYTRLICVHCHLDTTISNMVNHLKECPGLTGNFKLVKKRMKKNREYANNRNRDVGKKIETHRRRKLRDTQWFEKRPHCAKPNRQYFKYPTLNRLHPFFLTEDNINKSSHGKFNSLYNLNQSYIISNILINFFFVNRFLS